MTTTRRPVVVGLPDAADAPATAEERYLFLAVDSHMLDTLRDRHLAAVEATRFAEAHGLDECALEPKVLDAVYRELSDADLEDALRSPVTRARARAELTRRAQA